MYSTWWSPLHILVPFDNQTCPWVFEIIPGNKAPTFQTSNWNSFCPHRSQNSHKPFCFLINWQWIAGGKCGISINWKIATTKHMESCCLQNTLYNFLKLLSLQWCYNERFCFLEFYTLHIPLFLTLPLLNHLS